MKDVMTEIIPFASLRLCAFALNRERKDARARETQRMKIAVYAGVEYSYHFSTQISHLLKEVCRKENNNHIKDDEHAKIMQ